MGSLAHDLQINIIRSGSGSSSWRRAGVAGAGGATAGAATGGGAGAAAPKTKFDKPSEPPREPYLGSVLRAVQSQSCGGALGMTKTKNTGCFNMLTSQVPPHTQDCL